MYYIKFVITCWLKAKSFTWNFICTSIHRDEILYIYKKKTGKYLLTTRNSQELENPPLPNHGFTSRKLTQKYVCLVLFVILSLLCSQQSMKLKSRQIIEYLRFNIVEKLSSFNVKSKIWVSFICCQDSDFKGRNRDSFECVWVWKTTKCTCD